MKVTEIEKLNQLVSRTDMSGNEKVEWLTDFIDKHVTEQSCLGAVISRFNSDTFIDNVCLSFRHDYELMAEQDKQRLRFECGEWMRAISTVL